MSMKNLNEDMLEAPGACNQLQRPNEPVEQFIAAPIQVDERDDVKVVKTMLIHRYRH